MLLSGESDAGGGGGSFIDSSAIAILAEVPGSLSPGAGLLRGYGEIIITAVPEPASASLFAVGALALLARRRRARGSDGRTAADCHRAANREW